MANKTNEINAQSRKGRRIVSIRVSNEVRNPKKKSWILNTSARERAAIGIESGRSRITLTDIYHRLDQNSLNDLFFLCVNGFKVYLRQAKNAGKRAALGLSKIPPSKPVFPSVPSSTKKCISGKT